MAKKLKVSRRIETTSVKMYIDLLQSGYILP